MSPTSYQAAPPRINTLSNRPLISVYLIPTWRTQALPWCHHHKLRRGSIGTAAIGVNPHKLCSPRRAYAALFGNLLKVGPQLERSAVSQYGASVALSSGNRLLPSRSAIKLGGIPTAARIVAGMDLSGADGVLNQLYALDADLAEQISDHIMPFEKLAQADTRSLQVLVREIESGVLMIALKGLAKPLRDPFLNSMSSRARALFIDEMEEMSPIRRSDVEAARAAVARCARLLSDQGQFVLPQEGLVR